jgi:hypothetical protein
MRAALLESGGQVASASRRFPTVGLLVCGLGIAVAVAVIVMASGGSKKEAPGGASGPSTTKAGLERPSP